MVSFLSAHGYDPGPTQRPLLVGALCGVAAAIPAVGILWLFGSILVEARILHLSVTATLAAGFATMAVAGAIYGRAFGRAANDKRGGWLFGMAYAFGLWAAGAVFVLPIASGGDAPAGIAAVGVFVSLLVWGFGLGLLVPIVQPHLHEGLETGSKVAAVGPRAAASDKQRDPRRPGSKQKS
jgi:hypothetical protein